KENRWILGSGH
nr:Chain C, Putative exported peptide YydF [Bacillus subtilis]8AI5_D Chain D, Putative exported peptide YydF [Bacillus subtilis]